MTGTEESIVTIGPAYYWYLGIETPKVDSVVKDIDQLAEDWEVERVRNNKSIRSNK